MAKLALHSLMWRRINDATVQSLAGRSAGQYHITLGVRDKYAPFFSGVEPHSPTALGGFTLDVPIEPFDGRKPVSAETLQIRYMGEGSARKDWNIPSQRPETAYPLWRLGRGLPTKYSGVASSEHFLIIARDTAGHFHARWLHPAAVKQLTDHLRKTLMSDEFGVVEFTNSKSSGLSPNAKHIIDRLRHSYNVLIYGPPGTGKTHLMQEVMNQFAEGVVAIDTEQEENPLIEGPAEKVRIGWVTFHQSYSYEEFVVGLRPEPSSEALINLTPKPGLLLELAAFAASPGCAALLIIDEINRGNTSRIFGEFITLLEPDKRLDGNGKETDLTVPVQLPYLPRGKEFVIEIAGAKLVASNPFKMPLRLYTLASMNSVDKSVAPLDTALRRRFDVVPLAPDIHYMATKLGLGNIDLTQPPTALNSSGDVKTLALHLLDRLNGGIGLMLGSDFSLGHWYLAPLMSAGDTVAESLATLGEIWRYRILPQLEELFHGQSERLIGLLRLKEDDTPKVAPLVVVAPPPDIRDLGGETYLRAPAVMPTAAELGDYFLFLTQARFAVSNEA